MSIYSTFKSYGYDGNCPVCLDSLESEDAVAHEDNGVLHPLHRTCAKTAAAVSNLCPICRIPIDVSSLTTWKDKDWKCVLLVGVMITPVVRILASISVGEPVEIQKVISITLGLASGLLTAIMPRTEGTSALRIMTIVLTVFSLIALETEAKWKASINNSLR